MREASTDLGKIWHEDFSDSFLKIGNSSGLLVVTLIETFIIGAYNLSGNYVTKKLNAVVRSILEACRTLGIWVLDLLFFYAIGCKGQTSSLAESFQTISVLQLIGFMILVYGTFAVSALSLLFFCLRLAQLTFVAS